MKFAINIISNVQETQNEIGIKHNIICAGGIKYTLDFIA